MKMDKKRNVLKLKRKRLFGTVSDIMKERQKLQDLPEDKENEKIPKGKIFYRLAEMWKAEKASKEEERKEDK